MGGGSLVWANTMYRAKPAFFTHPQWPDTADWSQVLPLCADVETAVERLKRHVAERWG